MVRISLFEHINFGGRELNFELFNSNSFDTYQVINIDRFATNNFNDITSSLKVENSTHDSSFMCFFFEHSNLGGNYLSIGIPPSSGKTLNTFLQYEKDSGGTFNDCISSILVVKHYGNNQANERSFPLNFLFGRKINQSVENYFNSGGSVGGGGGLFSHSIEREEVRMSFDANASFSGVSFVNDPLLKIVLPMVVTVNVPIFADSHYNVEIIFHVKIAHSFEINLNPSNTGPVRVLILEAKRINTDFRVDDGNFKGQIEGSIRDAVNSINSTFDLYLKNITTEVKTFIGNSDSEPYLLPGNVNSQILLVRPGLYLASNNDVSLVLGY